MALLPSESRFALRLPTLHYRTIIVQKCTICRSAMDWDNIRYFNALAKDGTLAGAGRQLGVRHSTVLRRIDLLEAELGLRLFDRSYAGYALTTEGNSLLESSSAIEEEMISLQRRLSGQDNSLTGNVRLAMVEALVPWVSEALSGFRRLHPGVTVEAVVSHVSVSLARHETDVALRVSRKPPESLFGRRVARLSHGIYAAHSHGVFQERQINLAKHDWISFDQSRSEIPQARWIAENIPSERVVLRSNHLTLMVCAAKAGLGLALLPCYLGDKDPGLQRLQIVSDLGMELWLLTHRDLKKTPRVRALMDYLYLVLRKHRELIEGRAPTEPSERASELTPLAASSVCIF